MPLPLIVLLGVWYPLGHLFLKEIQERPLRIDLGSMLVRILERVLDDIPDQGRVFLAFFKCKEFPIFVKNVRIAFPLADDGLGLLDQVHDGVVCGPVNPVRAHVYQVAVGQPLLEYPAA